MWSGCPSIISEVNLEHTVVYKQFICCIILQMRDAIPQKGNNNNNNNSSNNNNNNNVTTLKSKPSLEIYRPPGL